MKKYFNNLTGDAELYTYGMYAPIAVLAYKGNSRLFIRSETDLAINANYYSGIKWFVKLVYILLEYPAFLVYKHDVNMAIKKSDVVCNSKFILKKTYDLFSKKGKLQYPFIDIDRLKAELKKVNLSQTRKGVVFIGDSYLKGLNIALKISKLMPDIEFYFFSRHISTESIVGNITWLPWRDNEAEVYGFAKLVIVPSIWEEAYGRVSREAFLLNIPVLVSNRGGLPETVDGKQNYIVEDYLNPEIWKEKIENFL